MKFKKIPTRQELDAVCSDIPIYFLDDEGHKALVNTLMLIQAGILAKDGTVLKKEIRGGEIVFGEDGTVESGTGFIEPHYNDGHQGIVNWTEEELTYITRKANAKGLSMHIHTISNKAVNRVVNGGKKEMRNTLIHVYGVNPSDYKRMADNNIYVAASLIWHCANDESQADMLRTLPEGMNNKGYPIKSFFDNGVNISSHSDFPALCGSPDDPFGIMEIAVTGINPLNKGKAWWTEELITREQAITALTINIAKQMFLENERGSISTGKYADFLLVDKDVLTCPATEIHTAKPVATYFEGKKVFSM